MLKVGIAMTRSKAFKKTIRTVKYIDSHSVVYPHRYGGGSLWGELRYARCIAFAHLFHISKMQS